MSKKLYLVKDGEKDTALASLKAEKVIQYLINNEVKLLFPIGWPDQLEEREYREYNLYETDID